MSKKRMIDGDELLAKLNSLWHENHAPWQPGLATAILAVKDRLTAGDNTCNFRNTGWEERAKEG